MLEFIAKYWLECLFGLSVTAVGIGWKYLLKRIKKQEVVGKGVQALLRGQIIQLYNHYTEKGYIPIYGLENVTAMYEQYHVLGGNGAVTALVEELKELPRNPEQE